MISRNIFNIPTIFSIGCVAFLYGGLQSVRIEPLRVAADTGYELSPSFFRLLTAGYWPAAVDYLWIQSLQYSAGIQPGSPRLQELGQFYRLAQNLDPYFFETYEQGAVSVGVLAEDADLALEILDRGIRVYESGVYPKAFWDRPFALYIHRAFVNCILKQDFAAARLDFLRASRVPGAPAYLVKGQEWLKEKAGERRLALNTLKNLIEHEKDPEVRARLKEKLRTYEP